VESNRISIQPRIVALVGGHLCSVTLLLGGVNYLFNLYFITKLTNSLIDLYLVEKLDFRLWRRGHRSVCILESQMAPV
jgi:hypothetical protein